MAAMAGATQQLQRHAFLGAGLAGARTQRAPAAPARGLVIVAGRIGPGKTWEHLELSANGKPLRVPMHVRRGDTVQVIAGSDKGTVGTVVSVDTKRGTIVVDGVNIKTKHIKPAEKGEAGQILRKEFPVHHSNVALYSTEAKVTSRVGYRVEGGKKVRYLKKTGETVVDAAPEAPKAE